MAVFFTHHKVTSGEWLLILEASFQLSVSWVQVKCLKPKAYLNVEMAKVRLGEGVTRQQADLAKKGHKDKGKEGVWNEDARLIYKVVEGVARRTPWRSTCLMQALAAQRMLVHRGTDSVIHFGVKKSPSGVLEAHAWLSVKGVSVLGEGAGFEELG